MYIVGPAATVGVIARETTPQQVRGTRFAGVEEASFQTISRNLPNPPTRADTN